MAGVVKILKKAEVTEQCGWPGAWCPSVSVLAAVWQQTVSVVLYQYRFFVSLHLIVPDLCHDLKIRKWKKKRKESCWGRRSLMGIETLLSTGREAPDFPWRGKAALTITAINAAPKEKRYSTRKGRWGLEGWSCKWWLKCRKAQKKKNGRKQENVRGQIELQISQNRKHWW